MAIQTPFAELPHWWCFSSGYWLTPGDAELDSAHVFCGPNATRGGWCFFGDHPLLVLANLDLSDARLGMSEIGLARLPLLYCWRCDVGEIEYTLNGDGGVTLHGEAAWIEGLRARGHDPEEVRRRLRSPETDYPYPEYPSGFPLRAVALSPLTDEEQSQLVRSACDRDIEVPDSLSRPRHQVGGFPYLANEPFSSRCHCGRPTVFVASIADDCADPRGFTSNEYVQVVFELCVPCRRMYVANQVD